MKLLTALVGGIGLASAIGLAPAPRAAHAAGIRPRILGLPRSAYPAAAQVRSRPAANRIADGASLLHSVSLADLGRVNGYLQTARWTAGSRRSPVTMQYSASLFGDSDQAANAYGDSAGSLWQSGRPVQLAGLTAPAFSVTERGNRTEMFVVSWHGMAELELSARYPTSIDTASRRAVLGLLSHDAALALRIAARAVPAGSPMTQPQPLPPVAVAAWGTGPVVKSPSLMTIGAPGVSTSLNPGPGLFRRAAPALTDRTAVGPALDPYTVGARPVSQFARLATASDGGIVYDSAALFPDGHQAAAACTAMDTGVQKAPWLGSFDLHPYLGGLIHLAVVDALQAWQEPSQAKSGSRETVLVMCYQNVVISLASTITDVGSLASLADQLAGTAPTWLRARGTSIVDAADVPVHLAGVNWYGMEGPDFVVGGLDYATYEDILTRIRLLGYNSVRLPLSNQVIEQNPVVTAHLEENPELSGLHAMDILDRIVGYAGALGLSIILDDHRSDAGWSAEEGGLWYTPAYPDAAFVHDWSLVAQRYTVNDVVIGADLRNEPHGSATWGDGNLATDWRAAAERAGDAALAQNPHLLIVVEGIQFYGTAHSYWWGGNLMGVATAPVQLQFADGSSAQGQLVYSAHDYGKDNCGAGCSWLGSATSYDSLSQLWDQYWGYIVADPSKPYAAPVWVGEFGTCNTLPGCVSDASAGSQGQWFSSFVRYIRERHLGWAYWCLNGTQSSAPTRTYGQSDWYGLLGPNWVAPAPWVDTALQPIKNQSP
jgi:aryl-phospho-beta-D-glucosidase BglC (GH1 family)